MYAEACVGAEGFHINFSRGHGGVGREWFEVCGSQFHAVKHTHRTDKFSDYVFPTQSNDSLNLIL